VVGGLSLILALFAMSTLPVSWTGLALIGMAVVLFVAEIYVASGGLLALAGAASLVLGSVMLFETEQSLVELSLWVMVPTVAGVTAFFGAVTWLAMRAQISRATTGAEGLVGMEAVAVDAGRVRVMGELWRARAPRPLEPGEKVLITAVDGLELAVEPQAEPAQGEGG
jgi:membrane-bound serine protease (ClpP class)